MLKLLLSLLKLLISFFWIVTHTRLYGIAAAQVTPHCSITPRLSNSRRLVVSKVVDVVVAVDLLLSLSSRGAPRLQEDVQLSLPTGALSFSNMLCDGMV
jgi:hypothetical protein